MVLTAADMEDAGANLLFCRLDKVSRDGSPMIKPDRPCLARERCAIGDEAIAVVIAESIAEAKDASELIELDVDVLPAVTDSEALADGAPLLHDAAENNRALDWSTVMKQAERIFSKPIM